ncbi:hypothetical protein OH77DRAFT_1424785 [Trametes cingulata]|nr:hypothetical protein OH77DRAFT_1424785 [Trametes cingulata]
MPAFSPVPGHSGPAPLQEYAQLALRVERLEQENIHLRQVQAEQRVELNIFRDLMAKMPANVPQGAVAAAVATPSPADSVTTFLQHIRAEESLVPDEDLGTDHVRQALDFPNIVYWQEHAWKKAKKVKKGKTTVGDVIGKRGKSRIANGENVNHPYLEDVNGEPIDGHRLRRISEFTRQFIRCLKQAERFAPSWKEVDVAAREVWFTAVRKKYPIFQLCECNWKAEYWMAGHYYDAKRKRNSDAHDATTESITLDSAPYTMESTPCGDSDPARIDRDLPTAPAGKAGDSTSSLLVVKRPLTPTAVVPPLGPPLPPKRPRLSINTDVKTQSAPSDAPDVPVSVPPANSHSESSGSSSSQTSGRARSALRISDSLVHTVQPSEPLAACSPSVLSPPERPASSAAGIAAPTPTASSTGELAEPESMPIPVGDMPPAPAASTPETELVKATPQVAAEPSKSAAKKPYKKSGGGAPPKPWPPSASETQPKWLYALEWLQGHPGGSREAFEHHYTKELSANDKRKLSRQFAKTAKVSST